MYNLAMMFCVIVISKPNYSKPKPFVVFMKIDNIIVRKLLFMYLVYVLFLFGCKMLIGMSAGEEISTFNTASESESASLTAGNEEMLLNATVSK